ncbi:cytochrome b [Microbulbifer sp. CAU 1566]|uniref:cytochrome b n=1 Tax=Microbulbifer sp. CAU 1566 TaxID=2933269 RepID=UPI002005A922|nr:cytochrome b [Microbulbifer sp. CAU 1566]MCK7596682.1 cytochrome b [Microbulbifer sp. CAU 1566]
MTKITNTSQHYGAVAILLHWLMAVLLIALIALGLYVTSLPDVGFDKQKIRLILLHKEYGILALGLAMLRLAWRVGNVLPELVDQLPDWQKVAARFVHLSFYGLMFALPITGWLMSSAASIPVYFFGLRLPDLIAHNEYRFQLLIEVHMWLGYTLVGFIVVHAAAALRHHFICRDNTLKKILPGAGY